MAADVQKVARRFGFGLAAVAVGGGIVFASSYYVKKGRRAVVVDRSSGVKEQISEEGLHFLIPFKQKAVIFDIRQKSKQLTINGKSQDKREVEIVLCITYRPDPERLVLIYKRYGENYDQFLYSAIEENVYSILEENNSSTLDSDREGIRTNIVNDVLALFGGMNVLMDKIEMVETTIRIPRGLGKTRNDLCEAWPLKSPRPLPQLPLAEATVVDTPVSLPDTRPKDATSRSRQSSYRAEFPKIPESAENKENEYIKEEVVERKVQGIYESLPTSSDSTVTPLELELVLDQKDPNTFSWSEEMEKEDDLVDHVHRNGQQTPDSDASVDSGRATGPPLLQNVFGEIVPQYEFEIHNSYVGLVIGVGGKTIKELSTRTGVVLEIRPHHSPDKVDTYQICQVRGKREQINKCLCMLRHRFPAERFPELNLQPVLPLPPITQHLADQILHPTWLTLPECVPTEVTVSAIVDPGHFFVQQPTHPSYNSMALLDRYMLQIYTREADIPSVPKEQVNSGVLCAAPVLQAWFRALTVNYYEDTDELLVRFVDHGGYTRVKRENLKQIRTDLMALPFQAVECYLAHVQPVDGSWNWSKEACEIMQEAVSNKIVEAHIVGYHVDDRMPFVELTIPDGKDKVPMRLDWLLMNLGLAKQADPSKMQRVPKSKVWNQMNGGMKGGKERV
ncbi:unnamed protein product, partial [Mesorhabditis spiculigera]